jgi:hypothetical protein
VRSASVLMRVDLRCLCMGALLPFYRPRGVRFTEAVGRVVFNVPQYTLQRRRTIGMEPRVAFVLGGSPAPVLSQVSTSSSKSGVATVF